MSTTQWTRRQFLQHAALTTTALSIRTSFAQTATTDAPLVKTQLGTLRGEAKDGLHIFRGVPFAQPPVGPRRFLPSLAAKPWDGVLDATHFAASSYQPHHTNISEDSLYLNIYTPAKVDQPLPVFVWIHGGGYTGGSPVDVRGEVFAASGIVMVTVAYRLGAFGFLDWSPVLGDAYTESANNGLRDVILALEWVQQNISAFGGDPARVTIGGQSAGAKITAALMGVAEARPLFSSMISESGGGERILDTEGSHRVTEAFLAQLTSRKPADILALSPAALIAAQEAMTEAWPANFPLRMQSGGSMLPNRALAAITGGSARGKRLLIGTCRDESASFLGKRAWEPIRQKNLGNSTLAQFNSVYPGYAKIYPDMPFYQRNIRALTAEEYWMPSMRVAQAHKRGGGGPTWFYRLDATAAAGEYKGESYHSYDLGYVFKHLAESEPKSAHVLSQQMHAAWIAFILGNTPAADGLPAWTEWDTTQRPTMLFNTTSTVEQQPAEAELRLWDDFPFA